MPENEKLLEVKNLRTSFRTDAGKLYAVDDISFHIDRGETLCLVGESACGKSVSALSIMRLIPDPPGIIENGSIIYKNEDLLKKPEKEMRQIRGNNIAMIFQEPMTSLNPVFTCGSQIMEAIMIHMNVDKKTAHEKTVEMLRKVEIPAPEQCFNKYPHQMSGGMRQRVMIAMALSCNPDLLIADEPTTALDVTIQAQILGLLDELQDEFNMGILLITHDMGVVAEVADRVAVMYAGQIVESGTVGEIFAQPSHPYTYSLLQSIPSLTITKDRLTTIAGTVPNPLNLPKGCRFNPRCFLADEDCLSSEPELIPIDNGRETRCFHYDKI